METQTNSQNQSGDCDENGLSLLGKATGDFVVSVIVKC